MRKQIDMIVGAQPASAGCINEESLASRLSDLRCCLMHVATKQTQIRDRLIGTSPCKEGDCHESPDGLRMELNDCLEMARTIDKQACEIAEILGVPE